MVYIKADEVTVRARIKARAEVRGCLVLPTPPLPSPPLNPPGAAPPLVLPGIGRGAGPLQLSLGAHGHLISEPRHNMTLLA